MPMRAQLSILACILTIGHNIAYGKTYFVMLFGAPSRMPVTQLIAAMLNAQSANIDSISGATYSSEGLKDAVKAALSSARN
ncbi:MAG: FMN-binding protein [Oscillospiraceae bacterium]|nr:FMN-binding protein [Oscillospiraceae bacterium]